MKLAAIYNVFDGVELLLPSMRSIASEVDLFILVWQEKSNFGEKRYPWTGFRFVDIPGQWITVKYHPNEMGGFWNEKAKRNVGIERAKKEECTHFIQMDCDEFYQDFVSAKKEYISSGCEGSVARILTYFKEPTLRLEDFDNYYVPFIHKLNANTCTGARPYPYLVDPTRGINTKDVALINEPMHHFSYVRRDIELKIRNSSARKNIQKSNLMPDYVLAGPGTYLIDYKQRLIRVSDLFGLSSLFSNPENPAGIV